MFTSQHNHGLAGLVIEMVRDGTMGSVIMGPSGYSEWSLAHLVATFGNIVTPKQVVPSQDDNGEYDITTCTEFHQLLLTTLLAYGKALCGLLDNSKAETRKSTMNGMVKKLDKVWQCGHLLWMIVSSWMLHHHLVVCQKDLGLPAHDHSHSYHHFTNFKPTKSPTDADLDKPTDANVNTPADINDQDFVEDVKVFLVTGEAMYIVFLEWLRVQANHWLALATLSKSFGSHDLHQTVLDVYLIAVKHPNSEGNSNEVELWETTLIDLLEEEDGSHHKLNVEDVLGAICTTVHMEHLYIGTIHCEMAMATLAVFFQELAGTDVKRHHVLVDVLQVMSYCMTMRLISLMRCTELGPNHHHSVKVVLPDLLGTVGHLQGQVQTIPCP